MVAVVEKETAELILEKLSKIDKIKSELSEMKES